VWITNQTVFEKVFGSLPPQLDDGSPGGAVSGGSSTADVASAMATPWTTRPIVQSRAGRCVPT